ncbi:hypothetical protein D5086_007207 [Populus alba]|uniref:Uncharacterized protein n=1 Tax=Populus alba TaxID=43335 RepID=A0ACC4CP05_POPAL
MSLLSKLRCITVDVTGTLIAYKGELGDYYCMAAKSVGLPCPDYKRMHEGFKLAYTEMAKKYPCFGHAAKLPTIVWWKTCVRNSFIKAGYDYDEETFEKIFRRIYASFGSSAPYSVFPDSQPFLRWARGEGLLVGLVSNAEYRYQDVILPALGLEQLTLDFIRYHAVYLIAPKITVKAIACMHVCVHPLYYQNLLVLLHIVNAELKKSNGNIILENQGSEWDFGVFSGLEGVEKPDPRIYKIALERAGKIAPEVTLHIGDSMRKDYLPAKSVGMQALLLDRFKTPDAVEWKKSGATVLPDLAAVQEFLTSGNKLTC